MISISRTRTMRREVTRRRVTFPTPRPDGDQSDVLTVALDEAIAFFDPFCRAASIPLAGVDQVIADQATS